MFRGLSEYVEVNISENKVNLISTCDIIMGTIIGITNYYTTDHGDIITSLGGLIRQSDYGVNCEIVENKVDNLATLSISYLITLVDIPEGNVLKI